MDDLLLDDFDFDLGISDSQVLSATQLLELSMPAYSDISDDELIRASASVERLINVNDENVAPDFSTDLSDTELIAATQLTSEHTNVRPFKDPVSVDRLAEIQAEQFAKRTVDKALWAVTLFGEWRAQRNVKCLSTKGNDTVYIDKPFTVMTDEELAYAVPLFVAEVMKKDGSDYPPATLRDLVLSLQKHLEVNGRRVHFLTDEKFRGIRDTLDGLMKERARDGLGMMKRQAQVSL
jgi:hypothetical protein